MKRANNLIIKISDLNNLYHAFSKASRAKKNKADVILFQKDLYNNLSVLQKQILLQQIIIGNYNYFTIYDPKKRMICAASFPERVLHHAIMNITHNCFEKIQIYDSYATRLNKGTYKAICRANYFSSKYKYFLKLDIKKYFDSINHDILKNQLQKIFKDKQLLNIFFNIIDSYKTKNNKGIPIGNLTSQYFANHYLAIFDHFVKENLKINGYVRYMDDIIIWHNDVQKLNKISNTISNLLNKELDLQLKYKIINTTKHGLNFLSYRIFVTHIELTSKSKKRFLMKLKKYNENLKHNVWTQSDYQRHALPLFAFTKHASSDGFRKKAMQTVEI